MANPYVGEVRMFAGNFAPVGWAFCDGRLLNIAENEVLFTLLGTTYGGDGQNSFGLPNLCGTAPMHRANGLPLGESVTQATGPETATLKTPATLAVNYIISLQGLYPSA